MESLIQENVSLKPFNTFGIAVQAKQFVEITKREHLSQLFNEGLFKQDFLVLGGGSNILFTQDYTGLLIKINLKGIGYTIQQNHSFVTAQGGEVWNDLVWYCIDHQFPGLENMALIPGTVGASPVQNIGAYGTELMHVFYSCLAFDTTSGQFVTFYKDDCNFSYRESIFKSKYKNRYIIIEVTYKLDLSATINTSYGAIEKELSNRQIQHPTIKDIAEVVSYIRVEKLPDPSTVGNAGSFFKNPIVPKSTLQRLLIDFPEIVHYKIDEKSYKLAAGWLIEQCGWKGKKQGGAGVWHNQALVLINANQATGQEIFELSSTILNDVYSKFEIQLEREVNIF
ncbi:UDP-N-acetylmuramate dehydrogenase [Sphingobacterium sp. SYP-B4668]|uniref:UDP-N-acetylmuramate dehydrogenase n=1 Tax=Sphingobacterium sp. SYP-B4668 TaxID=2996035 RepID=UPI0022DDF253|nr:UDP-N-acetylmuramate dehydrogenase [Sphingobacterium sp. SYP-B4668]